MLLSSLPAPVIHLQLTLYTSLWQCAATTIKSAPVVATCSRAAAAANSVPEHAVTATDDVASTLRIGKRRAQSAELLTSSPYKKMLEMKKYPVKKG